jgi:hypothetical protein
MRDKLLEKLKKLEEELGDMEGRQMARITALRVEADMEDDYRENEVAKLVMEQHDVWYIRKVELKKEILQIKRELSLKKNN